MNVEILHQDIQTLLEFFAKNCYRAAASSEFYVSSPTIAQILIL